VRSVIEAIGVLKGKARRLDLPLDDAVTTQGTATVLIAAVHRVRRVYRVPFPAHGSESQGKRFIAWDHPVAKASLVDGLVCNALRPLEAFEVMQSTARTGALGLLARLAGQDVEQNTKAPLDRSHCVLAGQRSSRSPVGWSLRAPTAARLAESRRPPCCSSADTELLYQQRGPHEQVKY
jgi:hypothetical protein